jgi:hypothetical protein
MNMAAYMNARARYRKQTLAIYARNTVVWLMFTSMLILLIPLHEGVHWISAEYFNPWLKPVEIHLFDEYCARYDSLGMVVMEWRYPGAADDYPKERYFGVSIVQWINEIIAYFIQIAVAGLIAYGWFYKSIMRHPIFHEIILFPKRYIVERKAKV